MKPREHYRDFMRLKTHNKHLKPEYKCILAEVLILGFYVMLVQTAEWGLKDKSSLLIIIENVENSYAIEFSTKFNKDGYVLASKRRLKNQLPRELYDFLIKRGLNKDLEIGLEGKSDFLVHRLVACLYYNILGLEVHHFDTTPINNYIWNLVPVEENVHDEWKKLDLYEEFYLALEKEAEMKRKYYTDEYSTKASNAVIDILKLKEDLNE